MARDRKPSESDARPTRTPRRANISRSPFEHLSAAGNKSIVALVSGLCDGGSGSSMGLTQIPSSGAGGRLDRQELPISAAMLDPHIPELYVEDLLQLLLGWQGELWGITQRGRTIVNRRQAQTAWVERHRERFTARIISRVESYQRAGNHTKIDWYLTFLDRRFPRWRTELDPRISAALGAAVSGTALERESHERVQTAIGAAATRTIGRGISILEAAWAEVLSPLEVGGSTTARADQVRTSVLFYLRSLNRLRCGRAVDRRGDSRELLPHARADPDGRMGDAAEEIFESLSPAVRDALSHDDEFERFVRRVWPQLRDAYNHRARTFPVERQGGDNRPGPSVGRLNDVPPPVLYRRPP